MSLQNNKSKNVFQTKPGNTFSKTKITDGKVFVSEGVIDGQECTFISFKKRAIGTCIKRALKNPEGTKFLLKQQKKLRKGSLQEDINTLLQQTENLEKKPVPIWKEITVAPEKFFILLKGKKGKEVSEYIHAFHSAPIIFKGEAQENIIAEIKQALR